MTGRTGCTTSGLSCRAVASTARTAAFAASWAALASVEATSDAESIVHPRARRAAQGWGALPTLGPPLLDGLKVRLTPLDGLSGRLLWTHLLGRHVHRHLDRTCEELGGPAQHHAH